MNIAGHVAVARRHADDPTVWLGAALPDLAAIGRFRLLGTTAHRAVAEGIAVHHRTDDVFHRDRRFTAPMADLRRWLDADGLERGPARAVAHVGPELLIDGELLLTTATDDAVAAAFDSIPALVDELVDLVESDRRAAWRAHLFDVAGWGLPTDYHHPPAVARRLHRILRRRPRLAFPEEMTEAVARRLRAAQPAVIDDLDGFVADLADAL